MKQKADTYLLDSDRRKFAKAANGCSAQTVIGKRDAERKRSRMERGGGVAVEMRRRDLDFRGGAGRPGRAKSEGWTVQSALANSTRAGGSEKG